MRDQHTEHDRKELDRLREFLRRLNNAKESPEAKQTTLGQVYDSVYGDTKYGEG